MKLRPGDIVLIGVIAALALCIWLVPKGRGEAEFARVSVDGARAATLDLRGGDGEYRFRGTTVEIRQGAVRVSESDCADRVCVKTGWLTQPGQTAVCLPNRVSVQITGDGEIDAIAGG